MRFTRRRILYIILGIVIGLLLVGVWSYTIEELKFEVIRARWEFTYKGNIVIRDEDEFRRLWEKWCKDKSYSWYSSQAYPKIDFSKEMVIGVSSGECSDGDYVGIKRIEKKIGRIVVYVEEGRSDPHYIHECMTRDLAHIVKLERSNLPVVFSTIPNKGLEERIDDWIIEKLNEPRIIHIFGLRPD